MTNKDIRKKLSKGIVVLMAPVVVGVIVDNDIQASAAIRAPQRTASLGSFTSRTGSLNRRPSVLNNVTIPKYKLSRGEKILGGISMGVAGVSVIGTSVGLGLTEAQYQQSKKTYEDVIDRTYEAFYDEREKYMEKLFNDWGVPMPDKYKNPLKGDKEEKPTPGFSFGGGQ